MVHDWTSEDKKNPEYILAHPPAKGLVELVTAMASKLSTAGHCVVMDNYFSSVAGFRALVSSGYHAIGTLKYNHGVPQDVLWTGKTQKRAPGTAQWVRSKEMDILVQQWQDGGIVSVMSTYHSGVSGPPDTISTHPDVQKVARWRKKDNEWKKTDLPVPPAVRDYQQNMGGVDRADQVSACLVR